LIKIVKFSHTVFDQEDHIFVSEDPARIYRGLKDLLVDEFDIDRIEEGHMEFNVSKPKDRVRMHAFKEKSPHTVLYFKLSFKAKTPRDVYLAERPDDILKARVAVKAKVVTVYPGGEPLTWVPEAIKEGPVSTISKTGLKSEHITDFQRSKLYKILVGIWYNTFYSKEIHTYEEEAEETALHIHNLMREKFGIEKSIHRSGASHFNPPWK
jgi:hypothetical protein